MTELTTHAVTTMTSREIAELTGKEHGHVMRDIRNLLNELSLPLEGYIQIWIHPQNHQQYEMYALDRDLTLTLVSGYSAVMRHRIVKRWQELEAQAAPVFQVPTTLAGALRLAAEQAEQIERQQAALALAAPKVEFVDRYVASTGNKGFREVCKLLGAKENVFRDFLIQRGIMYRLAGTLTPFAPHLEAGRFVVKAGASEGGGHAFNQAKFTPKGVEWIAGEWGKWKVANDIQ